MYLLVQFIYCMKYKTKKITITLLIWSKTFWICFQFLRYWSGFYSGNARAQPPLKNLTLSTTWYKKMGRGPTFESLTPGSICDPATGNQTNNTSLLWDTLHYWAIRRHKLWTYLYSKNKCCTLNYITFFSQTRIPETENYWP